MVSKFTLTDCGHKYLQFLQSRNFLETNDKRIKGRLLHEGDMLLTARQWRGIKQRKATSSLIRRWPKDPVTGFITVPFLFGDAGG